MSRTNANHHCCTSRSAVWSWCVGVMDDFLDNASVPKSSTRGNPVCWEGSRAVTLICYQRVDGSKNGQCKRPRYCTVETVGYRFPFRLNRISRNILGNLLTMTRQSLCRHILASSFSATSDQGHLGLVETMYFPIELYVHFHLHLTRFASALRFDQT